MQNPSARDERHFETGGKPDRLLARQLKGAQASRSIHSIKSEAGTLLTNPKDINDHFHSELYTSNSNATHSDLNEMPKLTLPGKT